MSSGSPCVPCVLWSDTCSLSTCRSLSEPLMTYDLHRDLMCAASKKCFWNKTSQFFPLFLASLYSLPSELDLSPLSQLLQVYMWCLKVSFVSLLTFQIDSKLIKKSQLQIIFSDNLNIYSEYSGNPYYLYTDCHGLSRSAARILKGTKQAFVYLASQI